MSTILEIFGRAIQVDAADLIWHWLDVGEPQKRASNSAQAQQLSKIIALMGEMKLDAAQEQLRLYLFENPACIYGRMAAAALCLHQNRLAQAVQELSSVYMRQPNNTMALYALGHCYERLGKESQAVEFYQDCLKFKNYLQLPAQRLAAIYLKNGQLDKTIQQYELLKDQYPDDISALVTVGHLYIAAGRYENAVETFNTAILIHPDNFLAVDERIDQLIRDGQLHEALEQLEDMLCRESDRVDLIVKQADVLSMMGAGAEAVSQYQQALRLCPDFLEATIKLGTEFLQMQAEQLAAEQFNRAVEINDKIVDAYIGLATAQKLARRNAEALTTLSLAAAIQPNSSLLFAETANLIFKAALAEAEPLQHTSESEHTIEAVITAHRRQIGRRPQNPDLHYRLGVLLMSVAKLQPAAQCFQAALEINPTYARARSKLAVCLYEIGDKEQALAQLASLEHLSTDTLELHYKTALLYCNRLKFASSLINLDRHLHNNFAAVDATVNISIVLQNLGLLDRVAAMWENLSDTADHAVTAARP
jgi:tetratricopeptide (TPR) repeat protein